MFTVQICARYVNECKILVYVASIVMGYGVDGTGLESRKGHELFIFPKSPDLFQVPTSLLFKGYRGGGGSVLEGKSGRGVKLTTPPSHTNVKNDQNYTSKPLHAFMIWTGTLPIFPSDSNLDFFFLFSTSPVL
jgi:hypothetical protein